MIEALACGVPVAGYPVPGPLDIIGANWRGALDQLAYRIGAVDDCLETAIERALACERSAIASFGASFTWDNATAQFVGALESALIKLAKAA